MQDDGRRFDVIVTVEDVAQADEIIAALKVVASTGIFTGHLDFSFKVKTVPTPMGVSEYKEESIG